MNIAQDFLTLFRSREKEYRLSNPKPKHDTNKGPEYTDPIKEDVTTQTVVDHLNGKFFNCLGLYPIKEDGNCNWGVVDVDIYDDLIIANPNCLLDTKSLITGAGKFRAMPRECMITKSKSGGHHIWIFTAQALPYQRMAKLLQQIIEWMQLDHRGLAAKALAKKLKITGTVQVEYFPKGTSNTGGFLNIPYYGNQRRGYSVDDLDQLNEIPLEDFVKIGLLKRTANIKDLFRRLQLGRTKEEKARDTAKIPGIYKIGDNITPKDMPVCLEKLLVGKPEEIAAAQTRLDDPNDDFGPDEFAKVRDENEPQLAQGRRNDTMMQTTTMIAKAYIHDIADKIHPDIADGIEEKALEYNDKLDKPLQLKTGEVRTIVKSYLKSKYDYQCGKFSDVCNKTECLKRALGKGKKRFELSFDLREVHYRAAHSQAKDAIYELYIVVDDKTHIVDVEIDQFAKQTDFAKILFAYGIKYDFLPAAKFQEFRNMLLDVRIEKIDSLENSIDQRILDTFTWHCQYLFDIDKHRDDIEDILTGKVFKDSESIYFRLDPFCEAVYDRLKITKNDISRHAIKEVLKLHGQMLSHNASSRFGGQRYQSMSIKKFNEITNPDYELEKGLLV